MQNFRGSPARVPSLTSLSLPKSVRRSGVAVGAVLGGLLVAHSAHADVSSWIYTGGGAAWAWHDGEDSLYPTLQLETGVGSPPSGRVVVGGMLRLQPYFGHGTDLALLVRTATHQFVNGGWGVALDVGGYQRFLRASTGFTGAVVVGGPWGLTLSAGGGYGTHGGRAVSMTLGFDFARLTIYRRSGANWWENPFPAYRPDE